LHIHAPDLANELGQVFGDDRVDNLGRIGEVREVFLRGLRGGQEQEGGYCHRNYIREKAHVVSNGSIGSLA
jgi:hypothetical protein